ncbi:venom carboxylesterase-6-like [Hyposmocoma kahamanoa]|uniref:venom carboxylesterase-6-like n=1 Tax=Hyposmocoma kahamanoa TaxID=1477025 RepID=UPI000E6D6A13|nr:venom carboxylesterase-6-like [Hyposmocoma kahamanoa]
MLPFLIFIVFNFAFGDDFNPTVEVPGGSLEGIWEETIKGRTFASFERVPYAEPPVGGLRFEPPRPVKPWKGVWDATGPVENCLQYDPVVQQIMGAEDCLFVNIYSPSLKENANLPVMVFIHGGAFMYGSGSVYDPTFIMDWDMVVVTFNYRVGPLGFLSTGDKAAPGNIGLKDQAFALHWIKKNIKVFGGNPDSITLTGSSAGGASVHYHLLSPLSKGTFHRAMSLSGSAFLPWSFASTPAKYAKKLAMRVGCPTANSEEMVKCLRTVDGNALINVTTTMFEWKVQLFTKFLPTVEPSDVEGAFLTKHPYEASIIGDFYDVPLVITHTSEEGLYPAAVYQKAPSLLPAIEEQWDDIAPDMFHYRDTLAPEKMKAQIQRTHRHKRSRLMQSVRCVRCRSVNAYLKHEVIRRISANVCVYKIRRMHTLNVIQYHNDTTVSSLSFNALT